MDNWCNSASSKMRTVCVENFPHSGICRLLASSGNSRGSKPGSTMFTQRTITGSPKDSWGQIPRWVVLTTPTRFLQQHRIRTLPRTENRLARSTSLLQFRGFVAFKSDAYPDLAIPPEPQGNTLCICGRFPSILPSGSLPLAVVFLRQNPPTPRWNHHVLAHRPLPASHPQAQTPSDL